MTTDARWWKDKAQAHINVDAWVASVDSESAPQREEDSTALRLYDEREWSVTLLDMGAAGTRAAKIARKPRKGRRLPKNVVMSCVDGWTNLICRDRPHVNFLTKGADWSLQKKARLRTRFVEAHFLKRRLYDKVTLAAKHAGIFGRGFVHTMRVHGRIDYEVVPPWQVKVHPNEAMACDPRTMARVRTVDKYVAAELWPHAAKQILAAVDDRLELVDIWHLPSGPKAKDGVHCQVIRNVVTLSWKLYKWDDLPITEFFFDHNPVTWGGKGIAEELAGIQFELNSVARTIQNNVYHGGAIKCGVQKGSTVSGLSNALGCPVVEFDDRPPVFFTADMGLDQLLQYQQTLETNAFEKVGISQLNVQSQTPFASMSGRARLVHNQSYSQRFKTHHDRWEDFFKRLADRTLEAAADLAEQGQDVAVIFPGRDHLEEIKYSDVAAEMEDFSSDVWTASLAGETPAARISHIDQMMSLGMIDLAGALELYQIPMDLRAHVERVLAPLELAREAIDRIIEDGEPVTPTPMMDLKRAAEYAQLWYQRGVLRGVDFERLALLLDFHKMALTMLGTAAPANTNAAAGAAPAGPGVGGGAPLQQALAPAAPVAALAS
jgi:hypothetical protein